MKFLYGKKGKDHLDDGARQLAAQAANASVLRFQQGSDAAKDGMDLFRQVVQRTEKVGFDQRKGNLFEYIEAAKFNRNAATAGVDTRARITDAVGRPHDAADIELVKNGKVIREVQAKTADTFNAKTGKPTSAATSVFDQAGGPKNQWGKYKGMMRLILKDEEYEVDPETGRAISLLEKAKKLAEKRGNVEGGIHAEEYRDVAKNLTDELTDETSGIKSGGTTLKELKEANADPEKYARDFEMQQYKLEVKSAAVAGAVSNAIVSGVVSSISNAFAVFSDQKELSEAAKEIGVTMVKSGVRGGSTGAISAVLRIAGRNNDIPVISDSAAATVIAGGIIDVGVSIYAYGKGEIDAKELQESISNTAVKSTTTIFMTKAVELALGSCTPFVPMAIYSISSYMVACTKEIIKNAKLSAEEYQRLAALLIEETALINEQRAIMEEQLAQFANNRKSALNQLISDFDAVMQDGGNYDMAINSIVLFSNEMGLTLQHVCRKGFDDAMQRNENFILG